VRESIDGPEAGSQLLDDAEKSLINEMCNVSLACHSNCNPILHHL